MYDRLVAVVSERPRAIVVQSAAGDPDTTYQRLLEAIAAAAG